MAKPHAFLLRSMLVEAANALITAAVLSVLTYVLLKGESRDLYVWMRGAAPESGKVAMMAIDTEALYLWDPSQTRPEVTPRPMLAKLVEFLDAAGAKVIVLDIFLDRPAPGDEALAAAARKHGAVVGAERFQTSMPATDVPFEIGLAPSFDGAMFAGFANLQLEERTFLSSDTIVRGVPLTRRVNWARVGSGEWPLAQIAGSPGETRRALSLGLVAALLYQRDPKAPATDPWDVVTRACGQPPRCSARLADLGLVDAPGDLDAVLDVNFRGSERTQTIPLVSAADALRNVLQRDLAATTAPSGDGGSVPLPVPPALRRALEGRAVIVGRIDEEDRHITPYGFPMMVAGDMPGMYIHAHHLDNLLSGHHVRSVSGWLLLGLTAALVAGTVATYAWPTTRHVLMWLAVQAALTGIGYSLFVLTDGVTMELSPVLAASSLALMLVHLWKWGELQNDEPD